MRGLRFYIHLLKLPQYNSLIIICTTLRFSARRGSKERPCLRAASSTHTPRISLISFFLIYLFLLKVSLLSCFSQPLHTSSLRSATSSITLRNAVTRFLSFYAIQCRHWKIIALCHRRRDVIIIYKIEYFGNNTQICTTKKLYTFIVSIFILIYSRICI